MFLLHFGGVHYSSVSKKFAAGFRYYVVNMLFPGQMAVNLNSEVFGGGNLFNEPVINSQINLLSTHSLPCADQH